MQPFVYPSKLVSIVQATCLEDYRLDVVFDDGQAGQVSLACLQPFEGVFTCWNNPAYFQQGWVDADSGTVVWGNPNTQEILVDVAPDFLYHLLQTQALPYVKPTAS